MVKCLISVLCVLFSSVVCCVCLASDDAVSIAWDRPIDLGPGGYARVHRLGDARFMAAYSAGGGVVARFAPPENLRE
jgi:hypothetical protein